MPQHPFQDLLLSPWCYWSLRHCKLWLRVQLLTVGYSQTLQSKWGHPRGRRNPTEGDVCPGHVVLGESANHDLPGNIWRGLPAVTVAIVIVGCSRRWGAHRASGEGCAWWVLEEPMGVWREPTRGVLAGGGVGSGLGGSALDEGVNVREFDVGLALWSL